MELFKLAIKFKKSYNIASRDLESLFKIVQGQIGKARQINSGLVLISNEPSSPASVGRRYCSVFT